eukprot:scaffold231077_cov30-Tisochrysis_lutea.AAC.6
MSGEVVPALPERCHVIAYQNQLDRMPLPPGASRNDLFIVGAKVSLPGKEGRASADDYVFDSAFGPDTPPSSIGSFAVSAAVDSVLSGLNHILLVLGSSNSGKTELLEGTGGAGGEASRWEGLVEQLIKSLYVGVRDTVQHGPAGTRCRLQFQFLHIAEERVQDLLEPDCHTHDLELMDDEESGILIRDAVPEELKGEAHAIGEQA